MGRLLTAGAGHGVVPPSLRHPQAFSLLWGPTGLRGFAKEAGRLALRSLREMPQAKQALTSRDMPHAVRRRDTQAILSAEIDWNAPELQTLSPSARDFLERLLQVGRLCWCALSLALYPISYVAFTCFIRQHNPKVCVV